MYYVSAEKTRFLSVGLTHFHSVSECPLGHPCKCSIPGIVRGVTTRHIGLSLRSGERRLPNAECRAYKLADVKVPWSVFSFEWAFRGGQHPPVRKGGTTCTSYHADMSIQLQRPS